MRMTLAKSLRKQVDADMKRVEIPKGIATKQHNKIVKAKRQQIKDTEERNKTLVAEHIEYNKNAFSKLKKDRKADAKAKGDEALVCYATMLKYKQKRAIERKTEKKYAFKQKFDVIYEYAKKKREYLLDGEEYPASDTSSS